MRGEALGRGAIKGVNRIVNIAFVTVLVILLGYAGFSLWDAEQVFRKAEKSNYEIYKPSAEDGGLGFYELQQINPEVIAWVTVYGTNIDYPVAQAEDNLKYVNTNILGEYSLTGAIFLDRKNSKGFSDFNSILYGHHMEQSALFSDIGLFSDRVMFDTRTYGNLYFDGKDHGIEFFAFLHTDAYDRSVFVADVKGEREQQAYLDSIYQNATHTRIIDVTIEDNIILLTTCSPDSTNGRDMMIGRITDEVFGDTFTSVGGEQAEGPRVETPADKCWPAALLIMIAASIVYLVLIHRRSSKP